MMKNKNKFITKFAIVAVMVGLFSPSIQVGKTQGESTITLSVFKKAEARRGGSRARPARSRPARSRPAKKRPATRPSRNVNKNVNRNVNRNVNKNVNVNVNRNYHGGYHGGHHGYGHYHGHPILRFTTAVAIGSMIAASTMPTTCTTVVVSGMSYRRCDNSYYQPFYQGDTLVYKAVVSPY